MSEKLKAIKKIEETLYAIATMLAMKWNIPEEIEKLDNRHDRIEGGEDDSARVV